MNFRLHFIPQEWCVVSGEHQDIFYFCIPVPIIINCKWYKRYLCYSLSIYYCFWYFISFFFFLYLKRCSNNNNKILKAEETSVTVILGFVVFYQLSLFIAHLPQLCAFASWNVKMLLIWERYYCFSLSVYIAFILELQTTSVLFFIMQGALLDCLLV